MRLILGILLLFSHAWAEQECQKVVSLAPNITEILFKLELGSRLVGVSRYCKYPLEAISLPKVGGYLDPDFEHILRLSATSVFLSKDFSARKEDFFRLGLKTYYFDTQSLKGILNTIEAIGDVCSKEGESKKLVDTLRQDMAKVRTLTSPLKKVKTLIVIGSESVGSLKSMYVSGNDGFYNQLIDIAGGINVMEAKTASVAGVSLEGLVRMNPEVIIEIHADGKDKHAIRESSLAAWQALPTISAVISKRIYVLTEDYSYIPGPRFPRLLNDIVGFIHPEVNL